jgi:hypothetical protein
MRNPLQTSLQVDDFLARNFGGKIRFALVVMVTASWIRLAFVSSSQFVGDLGVCVLWTSLVAYLCTPRGTIRRRLRRRAE